MIQLVSVCVLVCVQEAKNHMSYYSSVILKKNSHWAFLSLLVLSDTGDHSNKNDGKYNI